MRRCAGWVAGANALALLRGALDAGILDAARTPRTTAELAEIAGIAPARVADICGALDVHGILTQDRDGMHSHRTSRRSPIRTCRSRSPRSLISNA